MALEPSAKKDTDAPPAIEKAIILVRCCDGLKLSQADTHDKESITMAWGAMHAHRPGRAGTTSCILAVYHE